MKGKFEMKIKDIKLHLFKDKVLVWVTSTHGLFPDSGPAGQIEFSLVRVITDEDIEGDYIVWSEIPFPAPILILLVILLSVVV